MEVGLLLPQTIDVHGSNTRLWPIELIFCTNCYQMMVIRTLNSGRDLISLLKVRCQIENCLHLTTNVWETITNH